MDFAFVDKLVEDKNGVYYLIIRQDPFDRTVDEKGKKTKDFKDTNLRFLTMVTKKHIQENSDQQGNRVYWRVLKSLPS